MINRKTMSSPIFDLPTEHLSLKYLNYETKSDHIGGRVQKLWLLT